MSSFALAPLLLEAQTFDIVGACRNGVASGAYELRTDDGRLRVAGAFAHGRKTGTFIFWNAAGARVAVIPYQDDRKSGTVALWYTSPGARREFRRKLEAPYVADNLNGIKRSWYPGGTRRAGFRYQHGVLIDAQAWDEAGTPRTKTEAEDQAAADELTDHQIYPALEALVGRHPPRCE
ncbi:MAG: hypothetical protein M3023_03370 [Pseudomonadota bacterium]|nr:hypothetical protein [Pseudomonadota bacterium]